jgi:hypothetical protein
MKKSQILIILALILVILVLFAVLYPPGLATISWDKGTEGDIAGNKIYYGLTKRTADCPPGGYSDKIELKTGIIGDKPFYSVNNLKKGRIYYFSLTSFDQNNNESCFSEEIVKRISYFNNAFRFWKNIIGLK